MFNIAVLPDIGVGIDAEFDPSAPPKKHGLLSVGVCLPTEVDGGVTDEDC